MRLEWPDDMKRGVVMWKAPKQVDTNDEVVVREDEYAVFYEKGKVVLIADRPGHHTLGSDASIVDRLGLGGKAHVYYVQKATFDGKFGSKEPFTFQDKEFGLVRLRLFGFCRYSVKDCYDFINHFVGTLDHQASPEIERRIRDQVVTLIYDTIGVMKEEGVGVVDLAGKLTQIEHIVLQRALTHLDQYGIKLEKITGLNISFPEEVQNAIDTRSSMAVVGADYTTYQAGKAAADDRRPVIVAENVRVGDEITIKDSVVQRSEIGHKGSERPIVTGGKRTEETKIKIEDSVVIRSQLGPGEGARTDVVQGKAPPSCPFCGAGLALERPPKFCPDCGKKLEF